MGSGELGGARPVPAALVAYVFRARGSETDPRISL